MSDRATGTIAAGVIAGSTSCILCSPLDVAKTRLQVQGSLGLDTYHGIFRSLQNIVKTEGIAGCYLGIAPSLATIPLFWAIYFPVYNSVKVKLAGTTLDGQSLEPGPIQHCIAAVCAGCISDSVTNPLWVARTRFITDHLHTELTPAESVRGMSTLQVLRHIVKNEGLIALYKGLTASFLGLSHVAIQFPLYEKLKKLARQRNPSGREGVSDLLIASIGSKAVASTATYPHEVLRSRMQDSRNRGLGSLRQTFAMVVKNEGYTALYSGLGVNLVRVLPSCGVTFLTFELVNRRLQDWMREDEISDS